MRKLFHEDFIDAVECYDGNLDIKELARRWQEDDIPYVRFYLRKMVPGLQEYKDKHVNG
jgi:hypothetical protein